MQDYSQITFDFFTPPTEEVKRQSAEKQEVILPSPVEMRAKPTKEEEIVEVIFPEQPLPEKITAQVLEVEGPVVVEPVQEATEVGVPVQVVTKSTRGRKSLKSFALAADLVNIPEDEVLFSKHYYSIGEVSEMFNVNASLLRFWESEFDIIQPRKNKKGDRHFRPIDIKNLQLIYDLLRRRKLTIDGAKDFLKRSNKAKERFEAIQNLQQIRSFLIELKASL